MKQITVLIADDNRELRAEFRKIIASDHGLQVVGEARNGQAAVEFALKHRPDVVLMDIAMPLVNGLEAARQICKALTATKVVILSAHSDYAYVGNAIEAGAAGYLLKQTSAELVGKAIKAVHRGETFFCPVITKSWDQPRLPSIESVPLTARERQVLQLLSQGASNKAAAEQLGIGVRTLGKHLLSLKAKLHVNDLDGLVGFVAGNTIPAPRSI